MPFFWSQHYDRRRSDYVGHAERWDDVKIDGSLDAGLPVSYERRRTRSHATIARDRDTQAELEHGAGE